MDRTATRRTRAAAPKVGTRKPSVPEDESADPVGPVRRPGSAKRLAQQKADFTAEGAPAPAVPAHPEPTPDGPS